MFSKGFQYSARARSPSNNGDGIKTQKKERNVPIDALPSVMEKEQQLSRLVGKPTMWFLTKSDTNQAVQAQKMARDWKFWL